MIRRPATAGPGRRPAARLVAALALTAALVAGAAPPVTAQPQAEEAAAEVPALAYYYIWYNASSWNRAKTDLPRAGRYSSDQESIMREHITLAKAAGLRGFLVSWKSTPVLNERLRKLIRVAEQEAFGLGIVYQGLDFERLPLPAPRVAADLDVFIEEFSTSPAFAIFDRPMVVWTGTWRFSPAEIESVTATRRDRLRILASARNPREYTAIGHLVDGDAYYWGAANPTTYPKYEEKLLKMAEAVHATGGTWVAPAAPGFDARLVGGTSVVDRAGGDTFRRQLDAALASSPDAVGIISWNEFSENTHVEPSQNLGTAALDILRDRLTSAPAEAGAVDLDSSGPPGRADTSDRALLIGAGMVAAFLLGTLALRRRLRHRSGRRPVRAGTSPV